MGVATEGILYVAVVCDDVKGKFEIIKHPLNIPPIPQMCVSFNKYLALSFEYKWKHQVQIRDNSMILLQGLNLFS